MVILVEEHLGDGGIIVGGLNGRSGRICKDVVSLKETNYF